MTAEEKMEVAESAYLKSIAILKRLTDIKNGGQKFNKEYSKVLWNYEAAIQGVLLYATVKSGVCMEETKQFIMNNTVTGDFLKTLNSVGKRKLYQKWQTITWDNILDTSVPPDKLAQIAKEGIIEHVLSFAEPLAKVDQDINTMDFAAEISQCVKTILVAVCTPDAETLTADIQDPGERYEAKLKLAELGVNAIEEGINVFNDAFLAFWKGSTKID